MKKLSPFNHPKIYIEYLCWLIQWQLGKVTWCYPLRFRVEWWKRTGKDNLCYMPGEKLLRRAQRFFRNHTGGRSHRCEFTDPERGALYGGTDGGFMDAYFERFFNEISDED